MSGSIKITLPTGLWYFTQIDPPVPGDSLKWCAQHDDAEPGCGPPVFYGPTYADVRRQVEEWQADECAECVACGIVTPDYHSTDQAGGVDYCNDCWPACKWAGEPT